MGEAPVLPHGATKLSQSGVCLTYLAHCSGQFAPASEDERLEAVRWLLFDSQKVNGYLGPYRFLRWLVKPAGHPAVLESSRRASTTRSAFSTSGCRRGHSCWGSAQPSPTSRWSATTTIRPMSSASTSRRSAGKL